MDAPVDEIAGDKVVLIHFTWKLRIEDLRKKSVESQTPFFCANI